MPAQGGSPGPVNFLRRVRSSSAWKDVSDCDAHDSARDEAVQLAAAMDDVAALNQDLESVCALFPDVRPEVFRELLLSFSEESRLYLVAEALLMNKPKVVRGRWRSQPDQAASATLLPPAERFREESYKSAVHAALCEEFKSLSSSAVKGVLAECNHSYTHARPVLMQLNSSSWSSTFLNWLSRRKVPTLSNHPLVDWSLSQRSGIPSVRPVASEELAQELDELLVAPVRSTKLQEQLDEDLKMAEDLNDAEAETQDAVFDCECCFTPSSFERMTVCSDGGHYLCYRCLRHTLSEALFGQGWAQSVDTEHCSLRCIAPGTDDCKGVIPPQLLRQAICSERSSADMWRRFEDRLVDDSLSKSGAELLRCPSCAYAEVKPLDSLAAGGLLHRTARSRTLACAVAVSAAAFAVAVFASEALTLLSFATTYLSPFILPIAMLLLITALPRNDRGDLQDPDLPRLVKQIRRVLLTLVSNKQLTAPATDDSAPTNKGRKFICQSPTCGAQSCLTCRTPWHDPHECYSAQSTSLRAHVEAALTAATKRTCPSCSLSFVKDAGCNKLSCPCGYRMCYLCRADVRAQGYAHFCPHFRASGAGGCPEACGRCDLYKDEGVALADVKARAEAEWWAGEGARRGLDRDVLGVSLDGLGVGDGLVGGARRRQRRVLWGVF